MKYFLLPLIIIFALASSANAGYREAFEKEFLYKSWGGEELEVNACIECHSSNIMKPEFQDIPNQWKMSWHYQNSVMCHDCHGGDYKDATMSMSHQRGFVGTPKPADTPQFCGKCHIGILRNYLESGHGKSLQSTGKGPNCVTCHGSHNIQKASIEIINEGRCTKCHSYERAQIMKQALFATENKMKEIESQLANLKAKGMYVGAENRELFSTQAEFHALFHTIDADLVKQRTDEFMRRLNAIDAKIKESLDEIHFRKNFSTFLMLLFIGLGVVVGLLSKTYKD
ncbi:MAG: cytochrome C [Nitrospirae bacterium]|nr:cytochrome C [Nitrospirota bacterium]